MLGTQQVVVWLVLAGLLADSLVNVRSFATAVIGCLRSRAALGCKITAPGWASISCLVCATQLEFDFDGMPADGDLLLHLNG